MAYLED